jgi:hypothetical protein
MLGWRYPPVALGGCRVAAAVRGRARCRSRRTHVDSDARATASTARVDVGLAYQHGAADCRSGSRFEPWPVEHADCPAGAYAHAAASHAQPHSPTHAPAKHRANANIDTAAARHPAAVCDAHTRAGVRRPTIAVAGPARRSAVAADG